MRRPRMCSIFHRSGSTGAARRRRGFLDGRVPSARARGGATRLRRLRSRLFVAFRHRTRESVGGRRYRCGSLRSSAPTCRCRSAPSVRYARIDGRAQGANRGPAGGDPLRRGPGGAPRRSPLHHRPTAFPGGPPAGAGEPRSRPVGDEQRRGRGGAGGASLRPGVRLQGGERCGADEGLVAARRRGGRRGGGRERQAAAGVLLHPIADRRPNRRATGAPRQHREVQRHHAGGDQRASAGVRRVRGAARSDLPEIQRRAGAGEFAGDGRQCWGWQRSRDA